MLLRIVVIVLSLLLAVSLAVNFFLIKRQDVHISFEKTVLPTPAPTMETTPPPLPTNSQKSLINKKEIGKSFTVAIKDSQGNNVGNIDFTLADYEVTDEITVNGRKATAVTGRKFLIITVKIISSLDKIIEIDTRDYVKLSVNNSDNWVSPDIHNDPTEVQPVSTKFTRLGFPINESDSNFSLQIGEPDGKKEILNLN